jgi:predicted nucleic acid-binding protein
VLVAYFASADLHHEQAGEILQVHADQEWAASVITVAELLVGPARSGPIEVARAVNALARLGIAELPLPQGTAEALAHLRVATGLRLPDCAVLLTAEHHGAQIATFDARLAAAAQRRGVAIVESATAGDPPGPPRNADDATSPPG